MWAQGKINIKRGEMMNKSIEGIIEKKLLSTISYSIKDHKRIKELANSIASDLKKEYKVVANAEVTGFYYLNKGDGKPETLYLHTTNGDLKVDVSHMSEALEYDGKQIEISIREL